MAANQQIQYDIHQRRLACQGEWDLSTLPALSTALESLQWPKEGSLAIDGVGVTKMDSAGAWLLIQLMHQLTAQKVDVHFIHFASEHQMLLDLIAKQVKDEEPLSMPKKPGILASIGEYTINQWHELCDYLNFVGHLSIDALRIGLQPLRWRWNSLASVVYRTGYQGLPIIALLSFMIGVVITYQMGLQLRNYGANIYIVDLLGLSVVREFGPLLTAIMVAGRTGSAFTAQLGMMKLNQEIDALDTMGVTPGELLLLPRIVGLFIALPLLTIWSDIFGVIGGMVISNNMLSITWYDFLHRFPTVIPLRALLIGLGKAPVFALIIASIGCFQGIRVQGSADSVGRNTTKSVVLAIFFIIVADAIFSIIFSKLKL